MDNANTFEHTAGVDTVYGSTFDDITDDMSGDDHADDMGDDGGPLDPVTLYFRDIGKHPLLSREEEVHYARLARDGDLAARDRMIRSNLRLVVKLAKRYVNSGMPLLDLVEEGNLGLMRAVEKYDPERGFRFSTYAIWWIRQAIERGIMNQERTVRLPVHVVKEVNRCRRAARSLSQSLEQEAGAKEIAEQLNKPKKKVEQILRLNEATASVDGALWDTLHSVLDTLVDDDNPDPAHITEDEDLCDKTATCLALLEARERAVVERRYGLNNYETATLEEVGADIGMSRERVRQIQNTALKHLAEIFADNGLTLDTTLI